MPDPRASSALSDAAADRTATGSAAPDVTARALLAAAGLPRLEARMLLEALLDKPRSWLLAHDTDPLPWTTAQAFEVACRRRLGGEPMAYILGWREFMGHRFTVTPGVLIPRPDTELLVETAMAELATRRSLLDLGTGSGAIAISAALACPHAEVTAIDCSAQALTVARANGAALGAQVRWLAGSWFDPLPHAQRFDVIVSNPPYIAYDDPHLAQGDLRFEPAGALTDRADGLADLASIIAGAVTRLNPGGALWVEHGWTQAEAVRALLLQTGFAQVQSRQDLAGIERISGGYL